MNHSILHETYLTKKPNFEVLQRQLVSYCWLTKENLKAFSRDFILQNWQTTSTNGLALRIWVGNFLLFFSLTVHQTPACQQPHVSALRSHDQPAAGDAAGKDTAFGRQCSMSSRPSKTILLMVAHAYVCVCLRMCIFMISSPSAAITHTFPSGLDPWPNKHHSHSISVHTHTHTHM